MYFGYISFTNQPTKGGLDESIEMDGYGFCLVLPGTHADPFWINDAVCRNCNRNSRRNRNIFSRDTGNGKCVHTDTNPPFVGPYWV